MNPSRTPRSVRFVRIVAVVSVLMFLLAACGQKPEVRIASDAVGQGGGGGGGTGAGGETGEGGDADFLAGGEDGGAGDAAGGEGGQAAGGQGGGGGDGTGGDGGTTAGGEGGQAAGGQGGGDGGGDGGQQAQGQRQPQGSDRTGLTDDKITLGLHAPVTGAAPLPVTSFEKSGDLYWRWVIDSQEQTVLGRTEVELIFRDDKYDPNSAIQVCRELAAKTFFLGGGGGTDQIQACGRFANQSSVPYFSAGVTERGLRGLPWYFASSMSYKAQGQNLLAPYVKKEFGNAKLAAVITDTPNFDDAVEGWEAGVQQQGIDYYKTLRHPKGDNSWYNSFVSELKRNNVDVVYVLTAPVDYIRFAQQASEQNYSPQWVGVGITEALNAVLPSGCPDVDGGRFFSPFPGLDWARQNEAEFFEAGERHDAPTDDIALALWGVAKQQHVLFERYGQVFGNDLTREDFRAVVEQQRNVETGLFPTLNYSPQDHFGADTAHLLEADCDKGEHVTLATFASGF